MVDCLAIMLLLLDLDRRLCRSDWRLERLLAAAAPSSSSSFNTMTGPVHPCLLACLSTAQIVLKTVKALLRVGSPSIPPSKSATAKRYLFLTPTVLQSSRKKMILCTVNSEPLARSWHW